MKLRNFWAVGGAPLDPPLNRVGVHQNTDWLVPNSIFSQQCYGSDNVHFWLNFNHIKYSFMINIFVSNANTNM